MNDIKKQTKQMDKVILRILSKAREAELCTEVLFFSKGKQHEQLLVKLW